MSNKINKKRPLPPSTTLFSEKGKKVFDGVRYQVYQWTQKLFNGRTATFETIKRNDSVIVIPVEGNDVYLIEERQPHYDTTKLGFVAGACEEDEDIYEAARRELLEETGVTCDQLHLVHVDQYVHPIEWFGYTFIATGLKHTGKTDFDGGEDIKIIKHSIDEVIEKTRKHEFMFKPRFIEYWLVEDNESGLRDILKKPRDLY